MVGIRIQLSLIQDLRMTNSTRNLWIRRKRQKEMLRTRTTTGNLINCIWKSSNSTKIDILTLMFKHLLTYMALPRRSSCQQKLYHLQLTLIQVYSMFHQLLEIEQATRVSLTMVYSNWLTKKMLRETSSITHHREQVQISRRKLKT